MKKIIVALFLMASFVSCKTEKKDTKKNPSMEEISKEKTDKYEEEKHNHHHNDIKIELLNGEKWTVDKPMMHHIKNIKKDVMQFKGSNYEDYINLADKINTNLELLTSNCTMTGQAHDELHKWLVPFLEMSEKFSESKNLKDAQENYQGIKQSFKILDDNFK